MHRQYHAWCRDLAVSPSNYHHSHFASLSRGVLCLKYFCENIFRQLTCKETQIFPVCCIESRYQYPANAGFPYRSSPFELVFFHFSSTAQERVICLQSLCDNRARICRCYHRSQHTLGWMHLLLFGKAQIIRRYYLAGCSGAKHSALSSFKIGHAFRLRYLHIQGDQCPYCIGLRW